MTGIDKLREVLQRFAERHGLEVPRPDMFTDDALMSLALIVAALINELEDGHPRGK